MTPTFCCRTGSCPPGFGLNDSFLSLTSAWPRYGDITPNHPGLPPADGSKRPPVFAGAVRLEQLIGSKYQGGWCRAESLRSPGD